MKIAYQFFEKENLIIQRFIGEFSFEKYISYIQSKTKEYNPASVKKVLNDFRDLEIKEESDDFFMNVEKMTEIRKNINKNKILTDSITVVFWVDKPLPTVIAQLFIKNLRNKNYLYCSSVNKILEILDLPGEFKNLKYINNNLINTY